MKAITNEDNSYKQLCKTGKYYKDIWADEDASLWK